MVTENRTLSFEESNVFKVESPFTLKRETTPTTARRAENNTTAISFNKYMAMERKFNMKGAEQIQETVPEQIVYAKEFTKKAQSFKAEECFVAVGKHDDVKTMEVENNQTIEEVSRMRREKEKIEEDKKKEKEEEKRRIELEKARIRKEEEKQKELKKIQERKQLDELEKFKKEELQAKQKLEMERKKILEEERLRLEIYEKEKIALQMRREEILKEESEKEKKMKDSLKKSLFQVSRQEQHGFGSVRTGHVTNKKMALLTRASSLEPSPTESPSMARKSKNVR